MTIKVSKELLIRDMLEEDIVEVKKLQLKLGDQIEISKITGFNCKEYLEWHTKNFLDCTRVLEYKGRIIGILGIEVDTKVLFFLTSEIPKEIKSMFIRHFKTTLETLLDSVELEECFILIDREYTISYNWARRYGFVSIEEITIDSFKAELMRYTKS